MLHQDVAIGLVPRPKGVSRIPVVLTRDEVRVLLARLEGTPRLVALLLYGSGLRLLEALQLREGSGSAGGRDPHPARERGRASGDDAGSGVIPELREHLAERRRQHDRDLTAGVRYARGRFRRGSPSA
ncbi:MAG TPA: hypothetical protein VJ794_03865 [Gemmatimonadales bacterium]|nr:hypothetical protein [Gemmatimonadales bacterium]